jgi:hypothetical protein
MATKQNIVPLTAEEFEHLHSWLEANPNVMPEPIYRINRRLANLYLHLTRISEKYQGLLERLREAMRIKPKSERGITALGKTLLRKMGR